MTVSLQDLIALCCVLAIVSIWLGHLRAREIALGLCEAACRRKDLQLLDQTIALRRVGLRSTPAGWRIRRVYRFDYSDEGVGRHTGHLVLLGVRLEELSFGLPARIEDA